MATQAQLEKVLPETGLQARVTDRFAGLMGRGRVVWAGMQPRQRVWAVAAALLLAGLAGWLGWYGLRTDWRVLYSNLDPEDARQAAQVLTQAQIPFRTAEGGAGLEVPAPQLDKARLATASKGGLRSGRLGFELFDRPNWVGSEFDERVNYQRALEGELEKTVGSLADVESARVHLVMPHDSLFRDQERPAKASVVLKLRHRTLAEGEPEAIRNLVASAVDGLAADRVALVDAAGHLPLGPKTAEAERLSAEEALEQKLIATLEPVTGPGNVRASVTLDYDPAASEETRESYDPEQTVTLSMQRTEQSSGPQTVPAGVPGTASNAPNSQSLPVYPQLTTQPQTARTESGTYGASKTVRHVVENPGRVRRLTAAIVVNDRMTQPAARGKAAIWQPRPAEELRHLTALAQAAVGFDSVRGDLVTVEDLAFEENRTAQPITLSGQVLATAEQSPVLVKYLALVAGLLIVVAFGVRPALRRAQAVPTGKELAKGAEAKEIAAHAEGVAQPALEPPAPDPERTRMQEIFDQVSGHLKREPAQSSRLLQSWIHSE
ncbi:MAG: flagellar basal-body MS-ring/collar protein FliF [Terracidiphilus sp.]